MTPPEPRCPVCGCYVPSEHKRREPSRYHWECWEEQRYRAVLADMRERPDHDRPTPLRHATNQIRARRRLAMEARLPEVTAG